VEEPDAAPSVQAPRDVRSLWRRGGRLILGAVGVVVGFVALGNLAIFLAWQATAHSVDLDAPRVAGVENLVAVDGHLWRSAAPDDTSYDDLAALGVRTVVDLRSGDGAPADPGDLRRLGIDLVRIPVRDGQSPSDKQVDRFLRAVEGSSGRVLVHCGAGVGRTGAMVAAYRGASGLGDGADAVRQNLAVGPPSLEQLVFASRIDGGPSRPPLAVIATSRLLDAPRRLWSRFG